MAKRKITDQEKTRLLSLKTEDVTLELLKELFAATSKRNAKHNTNDYFIISDLDMKTHLDIKADKSTMTTTVGRYIFNLLVLMPKIIQHTGYVNHALNGGAIGDLDDKVSKLLLEQKITSKDMHNYIDKTQWLGFAPNNFICSSMSYELLNPIPEVEKRKKELVKEKAKELEAGDVYAAGAMEDELLGIAKDKMKDMEAYEVYASGARGSFGNNYKNTSVMRGAIRHPADPNRYDISTHNLIEGTPKEEFEEYANMTVAASASRALSTQQGGYIGKQLHAAFQTLVLDKAGSNCGTTKTVKILITDNNASKLMYRYIVSGSKLILLDEATISKYIGKVVNLRTPMMCISDHICSKCAGELYYRLDIENVGLITNRVGTKLMNLALKSFHDSTVKVKKINIDDFIHSV